LDVKKLYQKAVAGMLLFAGFSKIIPASNVWDGATNTLGHKNNRPHPTLG